jgi:hypothetical protein
VLIARVALSAHVPNPWESDNEEGDGSGSDLRGSEEGSEESDGEGASSDEGEESASEEEVNLQWHCGMRRLPQRILIRNALGAGPSHKNDEGLGGWIASVVSWQGANNGASTHVVFRGAARNVFLGCMGNGQLPSLGCTKKKYCTSGTPALR